LLPSKARSPRQHRAAPGTASHPAIEQAALDILRAASEKLASAKTVSFVARGAFDVPARNGAPLFYFTRSEVTLVRPSLRAATGPVVFCPYRHRLQSRIKHLHFGVALPRHFYEFMVLISLCYLVLARRSK
jgi:Predicted periplasmic protein (DUF2092)